ncbi:MAG: hypothetical protein ABIW82_01295 [Dokdonella sp.]
MKIFVRLALALGFVSVGMPSLATASASDPFAYDSSFYGGSPIDDGFNGITNEGYYAQKLVRLADGDVVVAGLVPTYQGHSQGNGQYNLGLVRYGSNGERVSWSHPTSIYAHFNDIYLILPAANGHYTAIRDIKEIGSYIYVLADYQVSATNTDVYILAFGLDGSLVGNYAAFTTSVYETGGGLIGYAYPNCPGVTPCNAVIAVATYLTDAGRTIITAKRFLVGGGPPPGFVPNGTLSVDTTFGPYHNGANDYALPNFGCAAGSNCSIRAVGVAAVRTTTGTPTLYIGGERLYQDQDRDPVVVAVDGNSGNLISNFADSGFSIHPFDLADHSNDVSIGIAAGTQGDRSTDEIYMLSKVEVICHSSVGIGVLKLDGNGALVNSFWAGGQHAFGGDNSGACTGGGEADTPSALALDGNRLAIVGTRRLSASPGAFEPLLATLSTTDGAVTDFRVQPPLRQDGTPWSPGNGWNDVVASGNGTFTATGALIDQFLSPPIFGTARLRSDRIFANGFE